VNVVLCAYSVAHRDSVTEFHTSRWLLQPLQGIREADLPGSR
jgi:putative ATP-binding cassette transporter